jgi:hypothetical protein
VIFAGNASPRQLSIRLKSPLSRPTYPRLRRPVPVQRYGDFEDPTKCKRRRLFGGRLFGSRGDGETDEYDDDMFSMTEGEHTSIDDNRMSLYAFSMLINHETWDQGMIHSIWMTLTCAA